jgi:hypothetical protein|tara:strand:+ start:50 stop:634 length:585 start_codon:yes stop_codon:yes gene_type:complete
MEPYFKYVEGINFTEKTRKKLADNILSNAENYMRSSNDHANKHGKYDWNWFCPRNLIPTELMDEVGKRFCIPVSYEILGQTPYTNGKIHIDRKVEGLPPRVTLINFPIYPFDMNTYGPTNFFELVEGRYTDYDNAKFELRASVDYKYNLPVIFNLQEYHNAVNDTNDFRFNAQFTTALEGPEIFELYNSGKLFT